MKTEPRNWTVASLPQLGRLDRGRSRHRPRYDPVLYGGPYPFIQTGDVKASGGKITRFTQTYSETGLAQSRLWPSGTIVITIAANIAETAILSFPACFPDSVVGLIPDQTKYDLRFVEYSLRYAKQRVQSEATGTAQDNINLETLARLEIWVPPLHEQRAIAAVLGALDDKIELNRRMNETLEAMARALFKSWFVDFDPVRAKAEGRAPFGMDAATAKLLPDAFEESELGLIPRGWRMANLVDVTSSLRRGIGPAYLKDGGLCVLNQKCIRDARIDFKKARRHDTSKKAIAGRELCIGDVLVNSTGMGTLGRLAQVWRLPEPSIVDSHVTIVRADPALLLPLLIGTDLGSREAEVEALGEGSTGQTELSRERLGRLRVIVPQQGLQNAFAAVAGPMRERIATGEVESEMLAELREALLPRLLSGELRVRDAEKLVGVAS